MVAIAGDAARILVGDCLESMRSMEAASVDLVFTSPPYEDARAYGCEFALAGQAWVDWAADRFIECLRVCRGLVAWVVEGRTSDYRWSASPALLMADLHRRGVRLRKPPIYARVGIPGSGGPDWLRNDYEFVVCASIGRLPWSDNTALGSPPKWKPGGAPTNQMRSGRVAAKKHTKRLADGTMVEQGYNPPAKANPGNIVRCTVGGGLMGSEIAHEHPAPYPESLAEFFVRSFCPPGGAVLDPFLGSGTTAAVAIKHGRKAIGCELNPQYVEMAKRRIAKAREEIALFAPGTEG